MHNIKQGEVIWGFSYRLTVLSYNHILFDKYEKVFDFLLCYFHGTENSGSGYCFVSGKNV